MAADITSNSSCPDSHSRPALLCDLFDHPNPDLLSPSFQIRHFVCAVRERDFTKCWPFRKRILERCQSVGVTPSLPPFVPPVLLHPGDGHGGADLTFLHHQRYDLELKIKADTDELGGPLSPMDDIPASVRTTLTLSADEGDHFSAETKVPISNRVDNVANDSDISGPPKGDGHCDEGASKSQSLGETTMNAQRSRTDESAHEVLIQMEISGDKHVYAIHHQPLGSAVLGGTNISVVDLRDTPPRSHNDLYDIEGKMSESVGSLEHVESNISEEYQHKASYINSSDVRIQTQNKAHNKTEGSLHLPVSQYLDHDHTDIGPDGTKNTNPLTENMDVLLGHSDSMSNASQVDQLVVTTVANEIMETIHDPEDMKRYDNLASHHPEPRCFGNLCMLVKISDSQTDNTGKTGKSVDVVGTDATNDDKKNIRTSGIQLEICRINMECSAEQLLDFKGTLESSACFGSLPEDNSDVIRINHKANDISFDAMVSAKACDTKMADSTSDNPVSVISSHDTTCSGSQNIGLKYSDSQSDANMMERLVSSCHMRRTSDEDDGEVRETTQCGNMLTHYHDQTKNSKSDESERIPSNESVSQTEAAETSQCVDFVDRQGTKISSDSFKSVNSNIITTSDHSETENTVAALATDLKNTPGTKEPAEAQNFKSLKLLISGNGHQPSQEDSMTSSDESTEPLSNESGIVAATARTDRNKSRDDVSCISIAPETLMPQVCPVCLNFTSTSNTALNAHIDQCLEIVLPDGDREGRTYKSRIKPKKMRLMVDICAAAPARTLEDLERSSKVWDLNDKTENDTHCSLSWTSMPVRRQPRSSLHRNKGKSNLEVEGILQKEECSQEQEQRKDDKITWRHSADASCSEQETNELQLDTTTTETEVTMETQVEVPHSDCETMKESRMNDALKPPQLGFPAHTAKSRMARKRKKNGLSNLVLLWDVSTSEDSTQDDNDQEVDFELWKPLNPQGFTIIDTSADYERKLQQNFTSDEHELESLQYSISDDFPNNAKKIVERNHDYSDSLENGSSLKVIALDRKHFHDAQKKQKLSTMNFTSSDATLENVEEHDGDGHYSSTSKQKRLFPKIKSLLSLVATTKNMDKGDTDKGSSQRTLDQELPSIVTSSQDCILSKDSNHEMCLKNLEEETCPYRNDLVCANPGFLNADSCTGQLQTVNNVVAMMKIVDGHPDQNAETSNLLATGPEKGMHHCIDENNYNDGDLNILQATESLQKSVVNEHDRKSNKNADDVNTKHITTMQFPLVHPAGMGYVDGNVNVSQKPTVHSSDAPAVDSIVKVTRERNGNSVIGAAMSVDANVCSTPRASADPAAGSCKENASTISSLTRLDSLQLLRETGAKRQRIETSSNKLKNKGFSNQDYFETQYVAAGMQSLIDIEKIGRRQPIFRKPNISTCAHKNISTPSIDFRTGRNADNCESANFLRVRAAELDQVIEPISQQVDSCFPRENFSMPEEKLSITSNLLRDFAGNIESDFNHAKNMLQGKSSISVDQQTGVGIHVQQKKRDFHKNHYLDLTTNHWIDHPSTNGKPVPFYAQNSISGIEANMPNMVSGHLVDISSVDRRRDYLSEPTATASLGVYNSAEGTADQGVVHIFGNPVFKLMGQNVIVSNDKIKSYGNPHIQNGAGRFHSSGFPLETCFQNPQSQPVQSVFSSKHEACQVTGYSFMDIGQNHACMLNNLPDTNLSYVGHSVYKSPHISGLVSSKRVVSSSITQSITDKVKSNHVNKLPVEVFSSSMGTNSIDNQQNRMESLPPVSWSQSWSRNESHSLNQLQLKTSVYPSETPGTGFNS